MFKCYESTRTKEAGRTATNLYLQLKWDLTDYETHRNNVRTAKYRIDNKAPRTFAHLYYRPKKLQLELERFCTIQRDNKHLMRRIATIQREGAWIQTRNFHEIKSLNTWKRQQEMIMLAYNNHTMLNRLLDVHTVYNKNKLEDEYLINQKYRANIQKFPKDWRDILEQIKLMKKHIKKMVIAIRTGTYKPEMSEKIQQHAIEREFFKIQKAKQIAQEAAETEEKEKLEKEERARNIRDWKKAREERLGSSKKWREARDERLRLIKEQQEKERQRAAEALQRIEEKQRRRRLKEKEKLQKWKQQKSVEEELKHQEEKRRVKKKEQKRNIGKRRKVQKAKSRKQDQFANERGQNVSQQKTSSAIESPISKEDSDDRTESDDGQRSPTTEAEQHEFGFDDEVGERTLPSDLENSETTQTSKNRNETKASVSFSNRLSSDITEDKEYDFDSSDLLSDTDLSKSSDEETVAKTGHQEGKQISIAEDSDSGKTEKGLDEENVASTAEEREDKIDRPLEDKELDISKRSDITESERDVGKDDMLSTDEKSEDKTAKDDIEPIEYTTDEKTKEEEKSEVEEYISESPTELHEKKMQSGVEEQDEKTKTSLESETAEAIIGEISDDSREEAKTLGEETETSEESIYHSANDESNVNQVTSDRSERSEDIDDNESESGS